MNLTAYRKNLKDLIKELPAEAERLCLAQAQSGLTIVKNRSTNLGVFINSEIGKYADYSTNPIRSSRLKGKQRNQAGAEHIKKNRLTTWHEFRKVQGLTNEKVNLSYTNRMWSSMNLVRTSRIDGGGFMAVIGSTDPNVDKYLPNLRKRYGNFINPTQTEENDLKADTITDILQFIKSKI